MSEVDPFSRCTLAWNGVSWMQTARSKSCKPAIAVRCSYTGQLRKKHMSLQYQWITALFTTGKWPATAQGLFTQSRNAATTTSAQVEALQNIPKLSTSQQLLQNCGVHTELMSCMSHTAALPPLLHLPFLCEPTDCPPRPAQLIWCSQDTTQLLSACHQPPDPAVATSMATQISQI